MHYITRQLRKCYRPYHSRKSCYKMGVPHLRIVRISVVWGRALFCQCTCCRGQVHCCLRRRFQRRFPRHAAIIKVSEDTRVSGLVSQTNNSRTFLGPIWADHKLTNTTMRYVYGWPRPMVVYYYLYYVCILIKATLHCKFGKVQGKSAHFHALSLTLFSRCHSFRKRMSFISQADQTEENNRAQQVSESPSETLASEEVVLAFIIIVENLTSGSNGRLFLLRVCACVIINK